MTAHQTSRGKNRGRPSLLGYALNNLMSAVRMRQIGLPDIQRSLVWKNTKVRGLCYLVP